MNSFQLVQQLQVSFSRNYITSYICYLFVTQVFTFEKIYDALLQLVCNIGNISVITS